MGQKIFLYTVKHMGRQTRCSGISFGVLHADCEENATNLLMQKMGDNAYAYRIMEVTDTNGEGYIGIPSGDLLAFEN